MQVLDNLFAAVEAVHAVVFCHSRAELRLDGVHIEVGIGSEYINGLQVVFLPQCVVVHIVCGRYLQAARTEPNLHIAVFDNRDDTPYTRHDDMFATQPLIFLLFGVDADCNIAEYGLRTGGGHDGVVGSRFRIGYARLCHLVAEIVELAMLLVVDNLLVAQRRLTLRVPVDHTQAAVDKTLLIEVAEHMYNGTRACLVHGERSTIPVARATEFAQLFEDDASVLVCPIPRMLEELLTGEVRLVDALFFQALDDLCFGGNRGVVGAGYPAGILTFQAGATHQYILNGLVEHMPHVEYARHIGGRNNHGERLTPVGFAVEEFVVEPVLIPACFDVCRIVFGFHICVYIS